MLSGNVFPPFFPTGTSLMEGTIYVPYNSRSGNQCSPDFCFLGIRQTWLKGAANTQPQTVV